MKEHLPKGTTPRWFDGPGSHIPKKEVKKSFTYTGDFYAYVTGDGGQDCYCHFAILLERDAATQSMSAGSGLNFVQDAETSSTCSETK